MNPSASRKQASGCGPLLVCSGPIVGLVVLSFRVRFPWASSGVRFALPVPSGTVGLEVIDFVAASGLRAPSSRDPLSVSPPHIPQGSLPSVISASEALVTLGVFRSSENLSYERVFAPVEVSSWDSPQGVLGGPRHHFSKESSSAVMSSWDLLRAVLG